MEIKEFVDKVVSCKNKTITDEVFLLIQKNRELMKDYLRLVETKGLDTVNKQIGKMIMQKYALTNADSQNDTPESTLISSHTKFE
ncbi:MAG: hypothetical protein LBC77_07130 [Spirochaetaceae bacterium]|jgi:hypothetical protein|nr:hypothetical protein [Spirochaetaceae bacterium]